MPQGLFVWYEVTTDAPDAVRAFYEGVIGWRIADPSPGHETAAIDYRHIYRADGAGQGGMLVLRPEMIAAGARPWWVPYLMVDSVPDTLAAITADGARVWMPPTTIAEGTFAMVADPWGAPFYLIDPTPPPGQDTPPPPVFALDITQAVTWNELFTTDLPGARTFYARHFGFTYPEAMPMGAFGDYQFIAHPLQGRIGAMMARPSADAPLGWRTYFRVADVRAAAQAVRDLGGTLEGDVHEVPGDDLMIQARDPAGAFFGLVSRKAAAG
ncbi:putative enzyme related to lactoylglutathione lyase [Novosphingobium sp. 1529]|uniref:VOC family protein n=1 Tax=Novosphingobium sp. 1529 TaxID=3156424 RepID=UPI00339B0391